MNHFFDRTRGFQGNAFNNDAFNERFKNLSAEEREQLEERMKERSKMFAQGMPFGGRGFGNAPMGDMHNAKEDGAKMFEERLRSFSDEELNQFEERLNQMVVLFAEYKKNKS